MGKLLRALGKLLPGPGSSNSSFKEEEQRGAPGAQRIGPAGPKHAGPGTPDAGATAPAGPPHSAARGPGAEQPQSRQSAPTLGVRPNDTAAYGAAPAVNAHISLPAVRPAT